jgi:hypothetical protein
MFDLINYKNNNTKNNRIKNLRKIKLFYLINFGKKKKNLKKVIAKIYDFFFLLSEIR